jgi:hypothetical protein
MSPVLWLAPLLSFVGAALGAGLAFRAAQRGTQQRELAGRREEWGRRFTLALTDMADAEPRRRALGHALLAHLARSDLATAEERELADHLLTEAALSTEQGEDLREVTGGAALDDLTLVEEDGIGTTGESGSAEMGGVGRP